MQINSFVCHIITYFFTMCVMTNSLLHNKLNTLGIDIFIVLFAIIFIDFIFKISKLCYRYAFHPYKAPFYVVILIFK